MTTITILPEEKNFRAVAGKKESIGRTIGEAIDGLNAQLDEDESGTLLVVQKRRPDKYFTEREQKLLLELMSKKENKTLSAEEQSELERLIEAELDGARRRAEELIGGLKP
jgi:electron transfer flavoprotein alpha subunit